MKDGLNGNPFTMMDREAFKNANDGFIAIRSAIQNRSNSELRQELYKKPMIMLSYPVQHPVELGPRLYITSAHSPTIFKQQSAFNDVTFSRADEKDGGEYAKERAKTAKSKRYANNAFPDDRNFEQPFCSISKRPLSLSLFATH